MISKENFKKSLFIVLMLALSMSIFAMGGSEVPDNGKKNVAVSFDAMYELTKAIAKDKVNISVIIPEGMEPHDFEPKAKNLIFLSNADVLVYNGQGMEFWLDDALKAVQNKKLIEVNASKGIVAIKSGDSSHEESEEHDEKSKHAENHHHSHGNFDPHTWLGLSSAKIMIRNIAHGLSKADSKNAEFYQMNAKAYIAKLDKLLEEYRAKFKTVKNKHFVTGHAAFAYLCRDFGLEQNAVKGVFSEGEANAKQLANLVEYCRTHKIKTIFSEESASPEVSKTLANEVNASVEEIYTIEMPQDNKTYLERMEENLEKIYQNLNK